MKSRVRDLDTFYRSEPALYELDSETAGFEWIDCNDGQRSVVSLLRFAKDRPGDRLPLCVISLPCRAINIELVCHPEGRGRRPSTAMHPCMEEADMVTLAV
jgi:1,4-alpha-glucan branching enzyme